MSIPLTGKILMIIPSTFFSNRGMIEKKCAKSNRQSEKGTAIRIISGHK
jgi:hypothetical protein